MPFLEEAAVLTMKIAKRQLPFLISSVKLPFQTDFSVFVRDFVQIHNKLHKKSTKIRFMQQIAGGLQFVDRALFCVI